MGRRGKFIVFVSLIAVFVAVNLLEYRRDHLPTVQQTAARAASSPVRLSSAQDPTLRLDLLEKVSKVQYTGTQRNIFQYRALTPAATQGEFTPPPPPPPPPIPLRFFGFATVPGEPKKVFLAEGEDTYVAAEGDILLKRYRVARIGVSTVEIEDMEAKRTQTLPLEQQ